MGGNVPLSQLKNFSQMDLLRFLYARYRCTVTSFRVKTVLGRLIYISRMRTVCNESYAYENRCSYIPFSGWTFRKFRKSVLFCIRSMMHRFCEKSFVQYAHV